MKSVDIIKSVNVGLQKWLVKLIGSEPTISFERPGKENKVLLDTGSQVSMCDEHWLGEHAPEAELQPVIDFLD